MPTLHTHSNSKISTHSYLSLSVLIPLLVFAFVLVLLYIASAQSRDVISVQDDASSQPTEVQVTQTQNLPIDETLSPRL